MSFALVMALVALSVGTAPAEPPHVVIDRARNQELPCAANASLEEALKLLAPDGVGATRSAIRSRW